MDAEKLQAIILEYMSDASPEGVTRKEQEKLAETFIEFIINPNASRYSEHDNAMDEYQDAFSRHIFSNEEMFSAYVESNN